MFCSHCGAEIADDSIFCDKCGKPVAVTEAAADAKAAVESLDAAVEDATTVAPVAETQVLGAEPTVVQAAPVEPAAPVAPVAPVEPTQAMPSPVQSAPETQGYAAPVSSPSATTVNYGAPAAPGYAAAPAKKGLPLPAIIIGAVLALALLGFGIGNILNRNTPVPEPAGFAAECTDSRGNPTVYACIELSGAELNELCEQNGYVWEDGSEGWRKPDNSGFVGVAPYPESSYDKDQIAGLEPGGGDVPAYYALWMAGYSSAEDALNGLGKVDVIDSVFLEGGEHGLAVVQGPSAKPYLILIMLMKDGDYAITVYNDQALADGVFDNMLDDSFGTSVNEIWENITGTSLDA